MLVQRLSPLVVGAFAGYVVLGVVGLVLLRAHIGTAASLVRSGELLRGPVLLAALGALSYATSFVLWLVVLARVPLSVAYPIAVGATIAMSTLLAWLLLHEPMSVRLVLGLVTIVVGVALVSTA
ncbi:multidrug efflux SMR transporter [Blastococcus sp. TF02A-30]|uniref:DMT family transporter n=1 Tax=Blastococcus sp. TF02A-30 TaxID=2250580 RepID=UPI001314FB40|nr:SMR family transporter [Blastococcus sp. TF02A-30]